MWWQLALTEITILPPPIKGAHTIYFSSSLYIVNQKPMIPRTHFHCITTLVKFGHAFAYFVVLVY